MEALYLKSQGLAPEAISRLCAISNRPSTATFMRTAKVASPNSKRYPFIGKGSWLYRTSIEADLRQRPPASVAEAAVRSLP